MVIFDKIKSFPAVYEQGDKIKSDCFVCLYKPSVSGVLRVGIVASKKSISKKAVWRNFAKRRCRALLQAHAKTVEGLQPLEVVFVLRSSILTRDWDKIDGEFQKLLGKLKVVG
jgi:ribonuclease P protein component